MPDTTGIRPVVRRAGSADAALVAGLVADAEGEMTGFRGGDVLRSEVPGNTDQAADRAPEQIRFVCEVNGEAVGCLLAVTSATTVTVVRVYVCTDARGHGCGDAMIAELLAEARRRGAKRVDGWALPGDRETKNLYERNGLTARAIIASRQLNTE